MKRAIATLIFGAATLYGASSVAGTMTYDFESGAQGWTTGANATSAGGGSTGSKNSWALGTSLPGSIGITLGGTWWTNPTIGNDGVESSFVLSPVLTAIASGISISFDSYTSNESGYPTAYDVEHIQISVNGGTFADVHGALPSTLHSGTDQTFRSFTFSTAGLTAGDTIQYRFLYDTGDGCCGPEDISGWAFDNVSISDVQTVSEPGMLAIMGLALAGLGARRRDRKV